LKGSVYISTTALTGARRTPFIATAIITAITLQARTVVVRLLTQAQWRIGAEEVLFRADANCRNTGTGVELEADSDDYDIMIDNVRLASSDCFLLRTASTCLLNIGKTYNIQFGDAVTWVSPGPYDFLGMTHEHKCDEERAGGEGAECLPERPFEAKFSLLGKHREKLNAWKEKLCRSPPVVLTARDILSLPLGQGALR
jgi:hypothetical protein